MDLSTLTPGVAYAFTTKGFEPDDGVVIAGERKVRKFVGHKRIGPVGLPKIPFLKVEKDNGKRHLIAVETLVSVEPVDPASAQVSSRA